MHISIEGFDGVGKSTISKMIAERLSFYFIEKPLKYLLDPEGGDKEYLRIRDYFNKISSNNRALSACFYGLGNLYLYEAYKNENIVTDRHILSNYAWSYGEASAELFDVFYKILGDPDFTFILYADKEALKNRLKNRNSEDPDLRKIDKHEVVYTRMEYFAKLHGMQYLFIDTTKINPEDVVDRMMDELVMRGIIDG